MNPAETFGEVVTGNATYHIGLGYTGTIQKAVVKIREVLFGPI